MLRDLATSFDNWRSTQEVFEFSNHFQSEEAVSFFYEAYLKSPFRDQHGGSRFNNALWLHLTAKCLQPHLIVDSGTFTGASAWALSLGAKTASVVSFDIDLSHLKNRLHNVKYFEQDWSTYAFSRKDAANGICYFDDHIDQAKRLIEAHERGFKYAIFDDDFQISSFAPMAHDSVALPKVEFVLDESLRDGEIIEWTARGQPMSWRVNKPYLARAKGTIAATARFPNTSLITGIHQTPYRIVRLAV
jgi:hypothetical protein